MNKKLILIVAAVMLAAGSSRAVHVWEHPGEWWSSHFVYDPTASPKYFMNEVSLDLYGLYLHDRRRTDDERAEGRREGRWGGGVGLNWFLHTHFGIGADMNMPANGGRLIEDINGSAIIRLPLEPTGLAPYAFGGGGRATEPRYQWLWHAGGGIEWRLNPVTGLFADARYTWADKADTSDSIMVRSGVRVLF